MVPVNGIATRVKFRNNTYKVVVLGPIGSISGFTIGSSSETKLNELMAFMKIELYAITKLLQLIVSSDDEEGSNFKNSDLDNDIKAGSSSGYSPKIQKIAKLAHGINKEDYNSVV